MQQIQHLYSWRTPSDENHMFLYPCFFSRSRRVKMKGIWETHVTPINIVFLLFTWVNQQIQHLSVGGHL
jgi:hypothetical protein